MKKNVIALICLSAMSMAAGAQTADPVVMKIAGTPVTRSEFEYNYNKNNSGEVVDPADVEEYAQLFINYKLKVKAAEDAQLDTLTSFKNEFRQYRDQQIRPLLVSDEVAEKETRNYYDNMVKQLDGHDLRLPCHIYLRVPQKSTPELQASQKQRIDSIYRELQAGADFAEMAKKCSEDQQSAMRGGELTWFGPGQLVPDFEKVMYELKKGEMSAPFLSAAGYHIMYLKDAKELEPYEQLRPQILRFLESRGLRDRLAKQVADTLAAQRGASVPEVMDAECERLCAEDSDLKYLVQEYHDGLLLYEICSKQVWEPAAKDTAALEKYFKKNKKKYAWDKPHFYGLVYHTSVEENVKAVQKLVKKLDESEWQKAVRETMNADSVTVRMEMKLFAQGDNAFVDSLALGQKGVKAKVRKGFPYTGVVGRKLKKGPKKWTDVASQVVSDYQAEADKQFAEELRKRYDVEIYEDVLSTVNNH